MNPVSAAPAKRFPWVPYTIVLGGIVLAAAAPIISVVIAGAIANANGCRLDEGSMHPCVVAGSDRGEMLYTMFVLGWLMFLTLPAGALAFLVWLGALMFHLFARKRRLAAAGLTATALVLCFAAFGNRTVFAQSPTPATASMPEPRTMTTMRAKGPFEVKLGPQPTDYAIRRMMLDKQFHGELEASSKGEMLAAQSPREGSAGYVALEQVTGTLHGRKGSFVLQHSGTMDRNVPQLTVTVVPDSGTGELEGLKGKMNIEIAHGEHQYDFEYTLPEKH